MSVRRGWTRVLVTIGLLAAPSRAAWAQAPAAAPPPPPGVEASLEAAIVATSGNTSTRTAGLSGDLTMRPGKWVYLAKASYVQNEVSGVVSARTTQASLRGARGISKHASLFAQVGYLRDRFSGIDSRSTVDIGAEAKWSGARQSFGVDGSFGYAKEVRLVGAELSTALVGTALHYKLKMSKTSDLSDDLKYSQSLSSRNDYRLEHVIALTAKLSTRFSLKFSNTIRYVNAPVTGFKTTDTITSTALVAKF